MPVCKYCGVRFVWGQMGDRWVPLVPSGEDEHLDRTHVDEDGVLRASHRQVCNYTSAVKVVQLSKPVPAESVLPPPRRERVPKPVREAFVGPPKPKRQYRRKSKLGEDLKPPDFSIKRTRKAN